MTRKFLFLLQCSKLKMLEIFGKTTCILDNVTLDVSDVVVAKVFGSQQHENVDVGTCWTCLDS